MAKILEECSVETAIKLLSGKWKIMILWRLQERSEPVRFGELKRSVSAITEKMLMQQLKELEKDGIVERIDYKENPPRVGYCLSPLGLELLPIFAALKTWSHNLKQHQSCIAPAQTGKTA